MEQKYVMAAIDAALKAGEKILSIYNDPASDFEIERKADNSPLTIADRKAHEAIVAILNDTPFPVQPFRTRPDRYGFIRQVSGR